MGGAGESGSARERKGRARACGRGPEQKDGLIRGCLPTPGPFQSGLFYLSLHLAHEELAIARIG